MDRGNPYEAAFEAYLKTQGLCTVAVDETRRAMWGTTSVKNLDFIVLSETGIRLLVDVKGRQFPGGPTGKERYVWENWSTQEDLQGMASWARLFGPGSLSLFVFIYRIGPSVALPPDTLDLWTWREQALSVAGRFRGSLSSAHEQCAARNGARYACPARSSANWPVRFASLATSMETIWLRRNTRIKVSKSDRGLRDHWRNDNRLDLWLGDSL